MRPHTHSWLHTHSITQTHKHSSSQKHKNHNTSKKTNTNNTKAWCTQHYISNLHFNSCIYVYKIIGLDIKSWVNYSPWMDETQSHTYTSLFLHYNFQLMIKSLYSWLLNSVELSRNIELSYWNLKKKNWICGEIDSSVEVNFFSPNVFVHVELVIAKEDFGEWKSLETEMSLYLDFFRFRLLGLSCWALLTSLFPFYFLSSFSSFLSFASSKQYKFKSTYKNKFNHAKLFSNNSFHYLFYKIIFYNLIYLTNHFIYNKFTFLYF